MKKIDYELYLVTEPLYKGLGRLYTVLEAAIAGGVTVVQLRYKNLSKSELLKIGRPLKIWLERQNIPLIVNDNPIIAEIIDAAGVHLGQSDGCVRESRHFLGPKKRIGLSIESLSQIDQAKTLPVDYVAVSPVFKTLTKEDIKRPLGLTGVSIISRASPVPVIGIGGIDHENIESVIKAGASGVALISAIWDAEDPYEATKSLKAKIKKAKSNE